LKYEIETKVGDYIVDVRDFRSADKDRLQREIETMTIRRFEVAEYLMTRKPWYFFAMVEMGTDRIHHAFWRYMDSTHRLYEDANPYHHVIRDYYVLVDGLIGRLLAHIDDDTNVLVVSDHGAKRMDGAICVNEWLRQHGYLVLREEPDEPCQLEANMVDWARTRAWGEGGYYARIFLNVAGREPQGVVDVEDFERTREEIAVGLTQLGDEQDQGIGTEVLRPEELYPIRNGVPPDLLVYFGGLHWRSSGLVGGSTHLRENDTGPDDANHAREGLYVVRGAGAAAGVHLEQRIEDVAPTILHLFDQPIPALMQGSVFAACSRVAEAGDA
jgi:predicted AlkP superfamily phosphohydrolase/phosphomutase